MVQLARRGSAIGFDAGHCYPSLPRRGCDAADQPLAVIQVVSDAAARYRSTLSALVCGLPSWTAASLSEIPQLQGRSSRSSLHYDCHANLLCVVAGRKRVHLMHPDLTPRLYPYPLWGQSSNHSAVDYTQPDPDLHPWFQSALNEQQRFELQVCSPCLIHKMASAAVSS